MTKYIEVVQAARETVNKMLAQRSGQQGLYAQITTNGGRSAAAIKQGYQCTIDLPSFAADTVLTRAEADRMIAYIAHEVCHILHTDYSAWNSAVHSGVRVKHWTNALEDLRIEAHEISVGPYKALGSILSSLVMHLYVDAHEKTPRDKPLGRDLLNAPYVATLLGRAANPAYDLPVIRPLAKQLSPRMRTVIMHALAGVKKCTSTQDCLKLALELVALEKSLTPQAQPQPQPQPQPQGQGQDGQGQDGQGQDGQGQDGQGQDADSQGQDGQKQGQDGQGQDGQGQDSQKQGQDGQGQDADGQGQDSQKQGQDADSQGQDGQKQGQDGQGQDIDDLNSKRKAIEPDLSLGNTAKQIAQRCGMPSKYDPSHHLNTMTAVRRSADNVSERDNAQARKLLTERKPQMGVLFGQISRLLVSEERTTRTQHETSGRLDRRALVRMQTGAPDVFSRRDYAPGIDTAVMVLIDLSGSMASRIALAQITAWCLAEAAEAARGKLAIAGFKGNANYVMLEMIKDFHEAVHERAGKLVGAIPNSCTPLSAAIVAGAQDLANVTATRRILIMLTDGQCDLGGDAVKSACKLAAGMNVETVGIGIQCPVVIDAFPKKYSVNVNDLQQLASTGLGVLARMLEERGTN